MRGIDEAGRILRQLREEYSQRCLAELETHEDYCWLVIRWWEQAQIRKLYPWLVEGDAPGDPPFGLTMDEVEAVLLKSAPAAFPWLAVIERNIGKDGIRVVRSFEHSLSCAPDGKPTAEVVADLIGRALSQVPEAVREQFQWGLFQYLDKMPQLKDEAMRVFHANGGYENIGDYDAVEEPKATVADIEPA